MKRIRFVLIFLLIFLISYSAHAVKLSVGLMDFGTELPSTCKVGESFIDTDDALFYFCASKDTWTSSGTGTVSDIDTAAKLETVANLGAYASDILAATTEGNFKSIVNLEIGVDVQAYDVDTAKTDVAQTYTALPTFPSLSLTELTSAPTPVGGDWYHPDYTNFNPSGSGVGIGYYTIYRLSDTTYVQNFDNNGNLHLAGIPSPAYAHITGADYPYFDTETPHVLTYTETHGGTITNTGATQDRVYTVSTAYDAEMAFVVMVRAAYQMDIEPYSGGKIWLCVADTCTEGGADVHIRNTDDTPGDSIACKGIELTDGVYELWCKTGNSGWELTP